MAATDKPLRDQNTLDIFFAVSSIAMLISVVMMFMQDYNREFKTEQRVFRDVEAKLAQRLALEQLPGEEELKDAEDAVTKARAARDAKADEVKTLKKEIDALQPQKEKAEAKLLEVKADVDSIQSFLDIEIEENGSITPKVDTYRKEITKLSAKLAEATAKRDDLSGKIQGFQTQIDVIDSTLTKKLGGLKKLNDKFDALSRLSVNKEWGWGDWFRALPIIDGFASPTRIQQITNNDYGINYNFKDVTRFDRCTTCHLGIDRPAYTRENIRALIDVDPSQEALLRDARARLEQRREALKGLPDAKLVLDPEQLKLNTVSQTQLTDARVSEFCAHPRLDLYVGANSKHPIEKFGCTTCHQGQGSSTTFNWASHSPNDTPTKAKWEKEHGWTQIHAGDWEFPMTSQRFVESNCLKCHHQVTDLISNDRNEAPKLLRGYNLIRENGCFGCHEIAGRKGGRDVGPDMRLESSPPIEDLLPIERARIESDLDNRPGNLRKVGPSLNRLSEKTNRDFTNLWLRAPREFRPDTKMPHFYGVSNNKEDGLPEDQKKLPDTEIHAVTHYLFETSKAYLEEIAKYQKESAEAQTKDQLAVTTLISKGKLSDDEKKTLDQTQRRMRLRNAKTLQDLTGGYAGDAKKGRHLFIERGCLSCHSHQATEKTDGDSPAVISEAQFGPNLSQLVDKLGKTRGDTASSRMWLVQWLLDPKVHSPRSRMPMTHLSTDQAADIAAWLLAQPVADTGTGWKTLKVEAPKTEDLETLAKVYLTRLLTQADMKAFFESKEIAEHIAQDLPADDRDFLLSYKAKGENALKYYVGKKAVGRLGCYACHEIPNFESAKPIGVALNDWGKKDGSRLAFEDIMNFFEDHYYPVPKTTDKNGQPYGPKDFKDPKTSKTTTKLPYEKIFLEALEHHSREGYLNQKLNDPRSYDYNRTRAWDDRSRMPQFRFSRLRKKSAESDKQFEARSLKEEAEAREAVMTFVLGLVAEPVPTKMLNQPSPDRLAEIKGRQVLDNFNCAGCHLIRPGVFEIKTDPKNDKDTYDFLVTKGKAKNAGDHVYPNHYYWVGKNPTSQDRVTAHGILPQPPLAEDEAVDTSATVRLTQALRILTEEKTTLDIPAATPLVLSPGAFIFPPASVMDSREKLRLFLKDKGQYGGQFADLLVGYLISKDPKTYKEKGMGDSSAARPLAPPSLIGQGERTQGEWLYEFLLNPFPVRKMTLLRMPKFSLSNQDAATLVDYFASIERQNNTGIGLTYPFENIAQTNAVSPDYFDKKTKDYVARLKETKASGGKETMFDKRVAELTPIWQAVLKDYQGQKEAAQSRLDASLPGYKAAVGKEEEAKKKLDEAKKEAKNKAGIAEADAQHKVAKAVLESASKIKDAWEKETSDLTEKITKSSVDEQKKAWMERDAYLTDGFKLVVNKDLCQKCHAVGNALVKDKIQGPPLDLAHKRLRPSWTERWIANPNRFLPYSSSMPVNFPSDQPENYQEFFAGTPAERVQAVRDVLMVYPQAVQIPANRYWILPLPGDVK